MSAIETVAGTVLGIASAQAILALNGVDLPHALFWNLQIVVASTVVRFGLRRVFEARRR